MCVCVGDGFVINSLISLIYRSLQKIQNTQLLLIRFGMQAEVGEGPAAKIQL